MHTSLTKLLGIAAATVGLGVATTATSDTASRRFISGCASFPLHDSLEFKETIEFVVTSTKAAAHAHADLPTYPKDSVRWGGTAIQCDTVAARYQRIKAAALYDTFPLLPVAMLRVGANRWVADPHFGDLGGMREWITLDSTLAVVKVWRTAP